MSRGVASGFGLLLLLGFIALYLFDRSAYILAIRLWMPLPLREPFADTAYVMGQLECWRAGIDVYVSNPCDIFGRTQAYPPIWLRLWFLPASQLATVPLALLLAVGFILSLSVLPRVSPKRDAVLLLAAIGSPVTGFAVERGNADLLIFMLGALAVVTAELPRAGRFMGYAGILLAALLKLYPIALLVLLARERWRAAVPLGLAAIGIWVAAGWMWHDELARAMANLPKPPYTYDGPGGRKLAEGLLTTITSVVSPRAVAGLYGILLLAAGFMALLLARQPAFSAAFRRLSSRENLCLTVGAALFCGCFVTGVSIAYREILLLFTLPALLRSSHDDALPWAVRWTPRMMVFLMWDTLPSRVIELKFGPIPAVAFWLACEISWWWLFVVLGAGLLCFLGPPDLARFRRTIAATA